MTRNLKALGLALVAVFAMSAIVAQVASAGELTSTGKVKLTAEENGATLTAIGTQKVECHAHYDIGAVNETPHGFMTLPATTFTVTPTYTACTSFVGELKAPSTVTMNGCDFVVHIGTAIVANTKYNGTADVVCPGTSQIEIHAYSSSTHESSICTYKIPAQAGLGGGFVENIAGGKIKLGGPVTGIHATRTGILCGGTAETNEAKQDVSAEVGGTNEEGGATSISVSGS